MKPGQIVPYELPDGSIVVAKCVNPETFEQRVLTQLEARGGRRLALLADGAAVPSRRFRGCWRADAQGSLRVDMPLARQQRLAEIRTERDKRFTPLDREWIKATGQRDAVLAAEAEAKRQRLRDLANEIEADGTLERITDADALASYEPAWP